MPSDRLEWHGHNDFHKVHINGATAWLYGCDACNATLFGYGERTGNPPLEGAVMEYIALKGDLCGVQTEVITELAEYMRSIGFPIPENYPFVGEYFNATRSLSKADALVRDVRIYSIFDTVKLLRRSPRIVTMSPGLDTPPDVLPLNDQRSKRSLTVEVYLPNADPLLAQETPERVRDAVVVLLKEYGFAPDAQQCEVYDEPEWCSKDVFVSLLALTKSEFADRLKCIEETLALPASGRGGTLEPWTRVNGQQAALLEALEPYDRPVIRVGDIVIAKAAIDGGQELVVDSTLPGIGA